MHLLIDGYNLLHVDHSLICLNSAQLQAERERLIERLSAYQKLRLCDITIVFDGWQAGGAEETREMKKGIEVIFSRLGEKADEVIKRLVREKGSEVVVVTSDREISKYAEGMAVAVISSGQFQEKLDGPTDRVKERFEEEEEERGVKKKGLSRRPSKKEKRLQSVLKKL